MSELNTLLRKKEILLRQLAALDLQINHVKATHRCLSNQAAPFFKLPIELIISIFEICICNASSRHSGIRSPFEIVASQVCSRWRDIILHLPHFWNTIDLRIRGSDLQKARILRRLSLYLSRSTPVLLDIFIVADLLDTALHLLIPHASRWRSLCLITSSSVTEPIYQALHQLSVPALEYISLRTAPAHDTEFHPYGTDSHPYFNFPSLLPQILSSTSSLSLVRLVGTALWTLQPSLTSVHTLHLGGCGSMHMTFQQFSALMATMPCLVNLSLGQLYIRVPSGAENGHNLTLATLKHVRICDHGGQPGIFMSLLNLPMVESLSLRNVESFDSVARPTVQSIAFEACPLSPNELWNTVEAFPSVVSLTMDQSVEALYALLGFSSGQVKWPALKTITIYDLIPINVQTFCDMVQDRIQAGKPLSCVRLNRRGRNVLKKKERLEWLCDRVMMENHDFEESWPPGLDFPDPDDN